MASPEIEDMLEVARGPLSWPFVRAILMSLLLEKFMEHGRFPELVQRGVFEVWRAGARQARWSDPKSTEIGMKDSEGSVPAVPESNTEKASFASIQELGVSPPPVKGWVPRARRGSLDSTVGEAPAPEAWYANPASPEWIYHCSDQMYFHLPSNSLWERRDMELACGKGGDEGFSYFRVDAMHFQALNMFAASLDSMCLPLAWNAWVRFIKIVRKKKSALHASSPRSPTAKKAADRRSSKRSAGSMASSAPLGEAKPAEAQGTAGQLAEGTAAAVAVDWVGDNGAAIATGGTAEIMMPFLSAGTEKSKPDPQPALASKVEGTVPQSSKSSTNSAASPDGEARKQPPARKGMFSMFACFRGKRRSSSDFDIHGAKGAPIMLNGFTDPKSIPKATLAASDNTTTASPPAENPLAEGEVLRPRTKLDGRELHEKRFEIFLAEVKKNPTRLVSHIEHRRNEKTFISYIPAS